MLRVTAGGLANNYVSLAGHVDHFPASAIGAADERSGAGAPLTLHFAGLDEAIQTDIAGGHKIFRRRGPWGRFFAHHRLAEGDQVVIERLSGSEYRVVPLLNRPGVSGDSGLAGAIQTADLVIVPRHRDTPPHKSGGRQGVG